MTAQEHQSPQGLAGAPNVAQLPQPSDASQDDTVALEPQPRIDTAALARYMRAHVEGFPGIVEALRFKGGQSNPTFLLKAGDRRYVLRSKPAGTLLASAHAVDREYRILGALRDSGVPVARVYCLCLDESVIGTMFYIMEYVQGRVFWHPSLLEVAGGERAAIYDQMNSVIAALHTLDPQRLGLADYGKPGNYFSRQIARWTRQYRQSETEKIEAMDQLIDWLPQHIPGTDETAIVHGDYRIDNLIFHPQEPRIIAVLDWELSTLGHPLADLSYHLMSWHLPAQEFRGLDGCDLGSLNIPSEGAYVDAYCRRVGREPIDPVHWEFYLAYNMFRVAGIRQGIMRRALDGNAASAHALVAGSRAREMAERGWRQVEGMRPQA